MKKGNKLSTIVAIGALTLASCGSQRLELESPRTGRLDSGLGYVTWTEHGSSKDHNNRTMAFYDGTTVEVIEHDGTKTLAGDYLQTYDIKIDGKLLLLDEEFERLTDPENYGVNNNYWKAKAIGNSSARAEVIGNVNDFYESLGSKRRVYFKPFTIRLYRLSHYERKQHCYYKRQRLSSWRNS